MTDEKKVECPHCKEAFMIPVDAGPTAAEIAAMVGQETGHIDTLLKHGVSTMFGYPGGAVLPFYDALSFHPELTSDTRIHQYFLSMR